MRANKVEPDSDTYTQLLEALYEKNNTDDLLCVLHQMDSSVKLECKTYSKVAYKLLKAHKAHDTLKCFAAMVHAGVQGDIAVFKTMVFGLRNIGYVHLAKPVFDEMERAGFKTSTEMFNAFISGLQNKKDKIEAFRQMDRMKVKADHQTPSDLVEELISAGLNGLAEEIRHFQEHPEIATANQDITKTTITMNTLAAKGQVPRNVEKMEGEYNRLLKDHPEIASDNVFYNIRIKGFMNAQQYDRAINLLLR